MHPSSEHDRLQQSAKDHLLLHFSKQEIDDLLVLERGEGPYVFDTKGRRYIDALSSLFCSQLGYSYGEEMADATHADGTMTATEAIRGTSRVKRGTSSPRARAFWARRWSASTSMTSPSRTAVDARW